MSGEDEVAGAPGNARGDVESPAAGATQLGRRRRPAADDAPHGTQDPDQQPEPVPATDGTQLGRRRQGDNPPEPASNDTQLGRRAPEPVPATDGTQLGRRRQGDDPPEPVSNDTQLGRRVGTPDEEPAVAETGLGQRSRDVHETGVGRRTPAPAERDASATPAPDEHGITRFGPGVPRGPATAPEWSARPQSSTRKRGRNRRPWIGALITIALVAGVLAWLLTRVTDPVQAHAERVTAASPPGACDTVVDVVGTIATNGRPGSITFQWIRNDGQPTSVLTQTVPEGATSVPVHLQWSFSGRGRFNAVATLRLLEPGPASEASSSFTYSCS